MFIIYCLLNGFINCKSGIQIPSVQHSEEAQKVVFWRLSVFCVSALSFSLFLLVIALQVPPPGSNSSLSDAEKKEKLALEKKLSEMEEELKVRKG